MMAVEAFAVEYEVFAVGGRFADEVIMKAGDDDVVDVDVAVAVASAVVVAAIEEDPRSFVARRHEQIDKKGIPGTPFHSPDS
jgi:hypothetical protein